MRASRYRRPEQDVFAWRADRLRAAGFEDDLAARIAYDPAMDLHALLGLIDRGCPPHLAVRIVAPLESAGELDDPLS